MGNKLFISYKYADIDVENITGSYLERDTVRDYVDKIEEKIDKSNHIYKGESDGEDLSSLSENTIWNKLKNRIYDSTLTIVLISKGMKENQKQEKEQWIPREISYSLKETSRINKNGDPITSKTNAMLAVVLPDYNGSYNYYIKDNLCCNTKCRTLNTPTLFNILKDNMFNIKKPNKEICNSGTYLYHGESSYIYSVKWKDFINDMQKYIQKAYTIQDNIDDYDIYKEIL